MAVYVDPKTGERYENDAPDAAEKAQQFGFVTPEAYDAEQRSGGFGSQVQTAGEEAIRQGAALIPGVDAGAAPVGLTELEPGQEGNALTDVYSPEARERRAVNPGAAGIGAAAPSVAASLLLPGSGALGLAATIGVDVASGYSQAAVDAEIENRGISGSDVLRNAGLNLAFSLPLYGLGEAARVAMQGKRLSALERAAGAAKDTAGARAAASEGADLAQAVADPAVQADLIDRVSTNASEAVARAQSKVEGLSAPVVARNPRAQREAVGAIADVMRTADPGLAARLDALTKGSARGRLKGLRAIRDELAAAGDSDALTAIDATIGREDLWGSRAIRGAADVDSVLGSIPDGADPEQLIEYAGRLRKVRDGEFAGIADEIEQLAERQIEIKTASAVGDVTPEAVDDVVDYGKAMRDIDPNEAWRLTHDGADDGLRQLESTSVSDAMQRVDDVLREDVAMSVKREDFVKGAETWTPAQVTKQADWAEQMRGRALALAGQLDQAETHGYRLGGFRAEANSLIDRTVQRLADADPVTANAEWDNLKRSLDSVGKRLAAAGQNIDEASRTWGSKQILALSDDMRKGLEDSELWGRNAGLQKETNAAWVNIIDPYSRITKQMAEFLGREFGVVGQAGIRRRFDPDMINSIMSRGYQRNLRKDLADSIKGLDQMMQARQSKGLSRLDRLAKAREDLIRIQQGFDFADLLAVAKSKAKAPIGLEIAGRLADTATPGGFIGSVAGPIAARAKGAYTQGMPMLAPGSKSPLAGAVRRHLGLTRSEQAAMLSDPAFYERLPGSLQKQLMGGSAAGERAVEMASAAADAAKRDRDLTVRLMVNPEDAKRARKAMRKPTPAIDRARKRAAQRGMIQLGGDSHPGIVGARRKDPVPPGKVRVYVDTDGMLWRDGVPGNEGKMRPATEAELEFTRTSKRDLFHVDDVSPSAAAAPSGQSPVNLTGKSLAELGALTDPASFRPGSFERLRGAGAEEFRKTGRVPESVSKADHQNGIRVRLGEAGEGKEMYLVDGRHRLTVAKEAGTPQIWGTVYDADGEEIYRGFIPLNGADEAASAVDPAHHAAVKKALDEYERISAERVEVDALVKKAQDDLDEAESAFQALDTNAFYEFERRYAADEVSRADYNKVIRARKAADKDRAKAQKALDALEDRIGKLDDNSGDADLEDALGEAIDAGADIPEGLENVEAARHFLSKSGSRGMVDLAGGIAKSPLGVGTGAAGAVVAYHHIAEPKQPDPESMTPLERFSDGYERPSDAFRAARKMIRDWQGNPDALVDMIAGHVGDVGQLSPKLEREMTGQAMRIAGYLQDNLPGQRNVSVVYPDGTPPSRAEVRQFALRFGAAVDPAGVMADARMGRLERAQLDTLFAVWPQEYDALRAGVIQELGTGKATTQTRQRMSLLFSFGSEVDPALGPRARAVVAAARGAQEQKAPAPSSPGMNRQKLPSTANMQPAGMAALSLGQQIGP